jgi:hypothetical protein
VGPRAGLNDVEKRKSLTLPGLEFLLLDCQARSQSLYRLSYPGSLWKYNTRFIYLYSIYSNHFSRKPSFMSLDRDLNARHSEREKLIVVSRCKQTTLNVHEMEQHNCPHDDQEGNELILN